MRAPPGALAAALWGGAIAVFGAACGIGGGLFAVPLLHYVFGLPLLRAVATSLCLVAATSISATAAELAHPRGALYPGVVLVLTLASLGGARIGFQLAQRIEPRPLKALFCVALSLAALRLLLASGGAGGPPAAPLSDFVPGAAEIALAAVIGLFAGVVVPLLGIGGGLLIVPALLFALPQLGFLGARAASMAVASVTATASVWLYWRRRQIDPVALPFAGGALAGALGGVWLVHLEGGARAAQAVLAVVLWIAAARFGHDVWRGRPHSPPAEDGAGARDERV